MAPRECIIVQRAERVQQLEAKGLGNQRVLVLGFCPMIFEIVEFQRYAIVYRIEDGEKATVYNGGISNCSQNAEVP